MKAALTQGSTLCLHASTVLLVFCSATLRGQAVYKEIEVKDGGTIAGIVRLSGPSPKLERFTITKNPEHCGIQKPSNRLILGKDRGVMNAIISIEGIRAGKKFTASAKATLDQRKCDYVPHVQILPLGSQLEIVNSDNILHNVHAYAVDNEYSTICNIAQPIKGQKTTVKQAQLARPGLILTTCDAGHPWMTGYILVAEHPYYAVTDAEGKFKLSGVPPGTYRVKMWHEGFIIVGRDLEKGAVKKYHFEDPYELIKEVIVRLKEKVNVEFALAKRD